MIFLSSKKATFAISSTQSFSIIASRMQNKYYTRNEKNAKHNKKTRRKKLFIRLSVI